MNTVAKRWHDLPTLLPTLNSAPILIIWFIFLQNPDVDRFQPFVGQNAVHFKICPVRRDILWLKMRPFKRLIRPV
jgi:hypothetical protein